ncbi:erythromycin esterase family protein [Saccharothrix coeruleofusca]|nr:erythromycin esterase family protein [Saccharothrix coeruleofusca]
MTTAPDRLGDQAVVPLRTLDPDAPLDDLAHLDRAIGDARVVAIGESAHYNAESYRLRHRLLRYLVERHGFTAYAMETGACEAWLVDDWVRGGAQPVGRVLAEGLTSLMGSWTQMREHLEWMRRHNAAASTPVGFYGIDLGCANASLLPALDVVLDHLARAEPESPVSPALRATAATFPATSAFAIPQALAAYGQLPVERRDALTAGLAELAARLRAGSLDHVRRTGAEDYERALRAMANTVTLDVVLRGMARGDLRSAALHRDTTIAETVEWVLGRERRVVLAAHNGHIQRQPVTMPGAAAPVTTMGMRLADRLGRDYLVIGTTTATGRTLGPGFFAGELFERLPPPEPGSLDALMAASHDGPFTTDLRTLSSRDAEAVRAASRQRYGTYYAEVDPLDAYDLLVHLPYVTEATPDPDALTASPEEVRAAVAAWQAR